MIRSLSKLALGLSLASLAACGGSGTVSSGGKAIGKFANPGTSTESAMQMLQMRNEAIQTARALGQDALYSQLRGKALTEGEESCGASVEGFEGATCTSTCDSAPVLSETSFKLDMTSTCTGASSTSSCGDVTYTMSDFNSTYKIGMDINMQAGTGTVSLAATMTGTLASSDDSISGAVDCKMNMVQKITSSSSGEMSCGDGEFSCKIGSETLSCKDLEASANSCTDAK